MDFSQCLNNFFTHNSFTVNILCFGALYSIFTDDLVRILRSFFFIEENRRPHQAVLLCLSPTNIECCIVKM